ncbi:preprotein translocase subunit SecG [Novosphingobium sp. 1949]|uniref:Protein-export membrane protein SecG n=1 Tax=Novosphingobium organovorum TaxID=2930092 RepID=A0ABT0B8D4_9SPHN|nr:preprotein translocase subunit SecG [Novosphingobium organovorum]MCJ2181111.1 preprotein translocase subunit SecG [Novosphingobium organovorum]
MFVFLTVVQALVAALLVLVILMQKSEGGGLGVGGGNPSGLMSARGAADFLTRSTAVLAGLFVILSIVLAAMAVDANNASDIDTSLQRSTAAAATPSPQPADPLAGSAGADSANGTTSGTTQDDPLAGAAKQ